jgi:hypothetical protein
MIMPILPICSYLSEDLPKTPEDVRLRFLERELRGHESPANHEIFAVQRTARTPSAREVRGVYACLGLVVRETWGRADKRCAELHRSACGGMGCLRGCRSMGNGCNAAACKRDCRGG